VGENAAPGDVLQLALFWKTDAPIVARYKVFIHIVGADEAMLTQVIASRAADLSDHHLAAGQVIVDRYGIAIPLGATPGRYRIAVGLYGFDNVRLNTTTGDRLMLGEIVVQ